MPDQPVDHQPSTLADHELDALDALLPVGRQDLLACHRLVTIGPAMAPQAAAVVVRQSQGWAVEAALAPGQSAGPDAVCAVEVAEPLDRDHGPVHIWLHDRAPGLEALRTDGATRTLLELRVPLPLSQQASIDTRPFRPGTDDDAWLAVNNRAFAWHPEQGGWTEADLALRVAQPGFDPDGFLLHDRDGRLAGFCWTMIHGEPDVKGEVHVIGVDPDFQGLGLGRELTLAGYDHLAGRGVPTGSLWVESDNEAALGLYRSLGMREHQRKEALVR